MKPLLVLIAGLFTSGLMVLAVDVPVTQTCQCGSKCDHTKGPAAPCYCDVKCHCHPHGKGKEGTCNCPKNRVPPLPPFQGDDPVP